MITLELYNHDDLDDKHLHRLSENSVNMSIALYDIVEYMSNRLNAENNSIEQAELLDELMTEIIKIIHEDNKIPKDLF